MKNIKKLTVLFLSMILCGVYFTGCNPTENSNPSKLELVAKNEVISTTITKLQLTLTNGFESQPCTLLMPFFNPTPSTESQYEEEDKNSSNILLASNIMSFIKRVADSGKVELYGTEEQVVSGIILDDRTTTMKFRIIIDEINSKFVFETSCIGKKYYNTYICLDAAYNYSNATLDSYTIVIDGDCSPNMQEFVKYDGDKIYKLKDMSNISEDISQNYQTFNNITITGNILDLIEEYNE